MLQWTKNYIFSSSRKYTVLLNATSGIKLTNHASCQSLCLRQTQGYSNKAFVVKPDWGRSRITQVLYHHEVPQAFHVCSDQPNREPKNLYLSWSPVEHLKLNIAASYRRCSTHSNWKNESFPTATETLMLWFCVTQIIMAVGFVATFQIRVGLHWNMLMRD